MFNYSGIARYHGCPIPDTDKDGVNDEEDSCINVPGLPQFHGCPDTDGDGIPDPQDKCPTVPGVAKYQGCPVPDSDGDGIPDDVDACPNQPARLQLTVARWKKSLFRLQQISKTYYSTSGNQPSNLNLKKSFNGLRQL
ncbi:MAG: thrombospondin type 3 repeat-containing protein [Puia sp.]